MIRFTCFITIFLKTKSQWWNNLKMFSYELEHPRFDFENCDSSENIKDWRSLIFTVDPLYEHCSSKNQGFEILQFSLWIPFINIVFRFFIMDTLFLMKSRIWDPWFFTVNTLYKRVFSKQIIGFSLWIPFINIVPRNNQGSGFFDFSLWIHLIKVFPRKIRHVEYQPHTYNSLSQNLSLSILQVLWLM